MDQNCDEKNYDQFRLSDMVAVKMRGLPWRVTAEQIMTFFENHKIIEDSICLGKSLDGRPNGWGTCLFESEEDAQNACKELEKEYIGERYVNLTLKSYREYLRFNHPVANRVNEANKKRCLLLMSLPFKVMPE